MCECRVNLLVNLARFFNRLARLFNFLADRSFFLCFRLEDEVELEEELEDEESDDELESGLGMPGFGAVEGNVSPNCATSLSMWV